MQTYNFKILNAYILSNLDGEPVLKVIFSTLLGLPVQLQMLISLNKEILRNN